jgi:hypothetical protein
MSTPTGADPAAGAGSSTGADPRLSPLAAAVAEHLDGWRRSRLPLDELVRIVCDIEPSLAVSVERRPTIADVIDELAAAELVELPAKGSWDRAAQPPLPKFVRLRRAPSAPAKVDGHTIAWHPDLHWAAGLRLSREQLEVLLAVQRFVRDGGADRVVPIRERSIQLLGDEKRLETLLRGPLFAPGRLTLEALSCRVVRPPFVFRQLSDAPTLLVVENHTTYDTLLGHLISDGDLTYCGEVGVIAYGAGRQFEAAVSYVAELPVPVERILYFGDVDDPGLEIPASASRRAVELGLPAVAPAAGLYRLLAQVGRPAPWERAVSRSRAQRLAAWLPDDLGAGAAQLLVGGQRLAQEAVGVDVLAAVGRAIGGIPRSDGQELSRRLGPL